MMATKDPYAMEGLDPWIWGIWRPLKRGYLDPIPRKVNSSSILDVPVLDPSEPLNMGYLDPLGTSLRTYIMRGHHKGHPL